MRLAGIHSGNYSNFGAYSQYSHPMAQQPAFRGKKEDRTPTPRKEEDERFNRAIKKTGMALILLLAAAATCFITPPSRNTASNTPTENVQPQGGGEIHAGQNRLNPSQPDTKVGPQEERDAINQEIERLENLAQEITKEIERLEEKNSIYTPLEFRDCLSTDIKSPEFEKVFGKFEIYKNFDEAKEKLGEGIKKSEEEEEGLKEAGLEYRVVPEGTYMAEHIFKNKKLISFRLLHEDKTVRLAINIHEDKVYAVFFNATKKQEDKSIIWELQNIDDKDILKLLNEDTN